jgi:hypothetical protein
VFPLKVLLKVLAGLHRDEIATTLEAAAGHGFIPEAQRLVYPCIFPSLSSIQVHGKHVVRAVELGGEIRGFK